MGRLFCILYLHPEWNTKREEKPASCSVQSLDQLGRPRDITDDSAKTFLSYLREALARSSSMGRDVHSFNVVHPAFLCWPWHHPPSKVPRGVSHARTTPFSVSLNSYQQMFLPAHKEADLALQPVVGLVLQCGEVFSGTWFQKSGSFSHSQQAGSLFHRPGGWR